ncbi:MULTISPECIES: alpha/beta fold hydrolase [Actinomadura]|uniref:Alpha/beta hydrolase n=1 Tax=Actinomadura litoris TaxID=2678616 RepID=A0A7K1LD88_9ACTN|nr:MULTISPECIES: hypothetical protein [Actinomadura]MBT2208335.1 hypothetical protein [Actinomadura sp. NEAU-AAG7]MUN42400.1 hypothetical protein [Actinomadura litoris]
MSSAHLDVRADAAPGLPWVVVCNTVGVPHTVFDRLAATLAGRFSVLRWSTGLTERDAPHGRPLDLTVDAHAEEAARLLRKHGVTEFVGVSWCSGTEILHRLSRGGDAAVRGFCCVNGAFDLGPDGPSSGWEGTVEPLFQVIRSRPESVEGVSALLRTAADTAAEGGDPALRFPYSTPERLIGYAGQCLEMKRSRTAMGFVRSLAPGLYLSGSADGVQPPAVTEAAARLSGSPFELVEGGGHAMMAGSQAVCDRIRAYCETVPPGPGAS